MTIKDYSLLMFIKCPKSICTMIINLKSGDNSTPLLHVFKLVSINSGHHMMKSTLQTNTLIFWILNT